MVDIVYVARLDLCEMEVALASKLTLQSPYFLSLSLSLHTFACFDFASTLNINNCCMSYTHGQIHKDF